MRPVFLESSGGSAFAHERDVRYFTVTVQMHVASRGKSPDFIFDKWHASVGVEILVGFVPGTVDKRSLCVEL
jgi:hypothetical protein